MTYNLIFFNKKMTNNDGSGGDGCSHGATVAVVAVEGGPSVVKVEVEVLAAEVDKR